MADCLVLLRNTSAEFKLYEIRCSMFSDENNLEYVEDCSKQNRMLC